jgi:hypothetical protein
VTAARALTLRSRGPARHLDGVAVVHEQNAHGTPLGWPMQSLEGAMSATPAPFPWRRTARTFLRRRALLAGTEFKAPAPGPIRPA